MSSPTSIASRLAEVRERIAEAERRSARAPGSVALVAVSKTHPAGAILEAIAAGQTLFGENRVQEFAAKQDAVRAAAKDAGAKFHLIGHLQSNKAARAVELFDAVDSVDSLRLAERLNEATARLGNELDRKPFDILMEVNVGGEAEKSGLAPDLEELTRLLEAARRLGNLNVRGLMTVPPFTDDPEGARPYFARLRELRDGLRARCGLPLDELSMGMSHDFPVAIEEGSTSVRVGTAIFGARDYPAPYDDKERKQ